MSLSTAAPTAAGAMPPITMVTMPPREVPMKAGARDAAICHAVENVLRLDDREVALPRRVAIRTTATAQIEGDHAPALGLKPQREGVEIPDGAGQARQADGREQRRVVAAIVLAKEAQAVAALEEERLRFHSRAAVSPGGRGGGPG